MKYTFLMPAYKAAFFREAIQSILNQTYKDFQLIISDDCSPEELKAIVDDFDDERIVYRRNETNIGAERLVDHWNLLLGIANTEYVILAPDDDVYSPRFLEEINKLTILHTEVNIFKSRSQHINANGEVMIKDMLYEEVISQLDNIYHQTLPNHISGIGNYVFKTKALKQLGGFVNYTYAWWSDVMTNILLANNGMAITKDILFNFRQSDQNISSRKASLKELRLKADATNRFYHEAEKLLSQISITTPYDKTRKLAWDNHMRDWRFWELKNAAKSYTIRELYGIIHNNKDIFKSTINKLVFVRYLIFRARSN